MAQGRGWSLSISGLLVGSLFWRAASATTSAERPRKLFGASVELLWRALVAATALQPQRRLRRGLGKLLASLAEHHPPVPAKPQPDSAGVLLSD